MSVGFTNINAQENKTTEVDGTYKVYSYTVIGSNDSASKNNLPSNFSNTFEVAKKRFNYSNYQLLSTQFQIIKNKGNIEYKSVLNNFDNLEKAPSIYADWAFKYLDAGVLSGKKQVGFNLFRFSMQMPVKNMLFDKNVEGSKQFIYQNLGITATKVAFSVGEPIIFATLPIEMSDKTLFFIIHIEETN